MFTLKIPKLIVVCNQPNITTLCSSFSSLVQKASNRSPRRDLAKSNSFQPKESNRHEPTGGRSKKFLEQSSPSKGNRKKFILKGKSDEYMNGLSESLEDMNPQNLFELDEELDLYATNENMYHDKVISEDMKKRKAMKLAIIDKKIKRLEGVKHTYFNLLTWDAKEQIKHLHLNDPEVWTPEKIADSYPITAENARKLLRSNWSPKTLDELATHDQKVINNWNLLADETNDEQRGPAVNIYEEFKQSNRLALLRNACGLPGVSFERSSVIHADSFAIHESILVKPGKFSSIIKRTDRVQKLFQKDVDHIKPVKLEKGTSIVADHLMTNKSELTRALNRLMTAEEKLKSEQDISGIFQQSKELQIEERDRNQRRSRRNKNV